MKNIINGIVSWIASKPFLFHIFRYLVEGGFKTIKREINNTLKISNTERVLDLGCGIGELYEIFSRSNYSGIDIEPEYIRYATEQYGNALFTCQDAKNTNFSDNEFDQIIVFGVFHHLSDADCEGVFKEMNRITKEDAVILIIEDTDPEIKYDFFGNALRFLDKGDYIRTHEEWKSLLSRDFNIKESHRIQSGLLTYLSFII